MRAIFEAIGIVGVGLSVIAYVPQLSHLASEHCSAGVSTKAWSLWLTSSFLVGALAIYRGDFVFIGLAASSMVSSAAILVMARKYRSMTCDTHAPLLSGSLPG